MSFIRNVISALKANPDGIVLPHVDRYLLGRNEIYDSIDEWIHPSSVPALDSICPRSIFFDKFTPIEKYPKKLLIEDHSPRTRRIFDNGHSVHRRWQAYLVESGIVHPDKGVGWEIPIRDEELGVLGHVDAVCYPDSRNRVSLKYSDNGSPLLTEKGFVIERSEPKHLTFTGNPVLADIKSVRDAKWRTLIEPVIIHKVQVTCYMAVLKINTAVLIYESKDTQEAKEFIVRFDPVLWASLYKVFSDLQRHRQKKTLPPKICDTPHCARAEKCDWADPCFSIRSYKELVHINGERSRPQQTGRSRR